jgi:hypothetical protein
MNTSLSKTNALQKESPLSAFSDNDRTISWVRTLKRNKEEEKEMMNEKKDGGGQGV